MPKGRKTGSNASKLTKLIRTTLIEKKNAPPTSENIQPKKEKPKVKEEPEDPCNIMEESFGSQARRLMAIAREMLKEDASTSSMNSDSAENTTQEKTEETSKIPDQHKKVAIVPEPPTSMKENANADFGINDSRMQQTSTAPDEKFDQLAGSSFTTQDSPLRRARPAKRNGIKSVRIEVQSDSVERKKKHNDEDPQKVQKNKNKKALTKGFMNDSSILPAKKRSRRDNIEAKKDDYDDPDREWEVLHVGGLCLEWGKRRRKFKNGRIATEWFVKPDSNHRIWIKWKDPFRDNGTVWSAEVQENLVGVDRELIERALRRKKCYPMPNPNDGLEDWEDRKIEAVLLGFTEWRAPASLVDNEDQEVQFIPVAS